jgi:hypothetical protein
VLRRREEGEKREGVEEKRRGREEGEARGC